MTWRARRLLLLLLATSASSSFGCLYRSKLDGRDFATPPHFQHQRARLASASQSLGRWWSLFGDPQLESLVAQAFEHNLDLEAARARIDQARARVMGATAGWFPTISGSAQASRNEIALNLPQGAQKVTATVYELSLSAAYEVDLWGRVRYARAAAKHGLEASEQDLRAAYVTVAANVADTYFLLVQQREQLALVEKTIENRANQANLVKERYRAGVARPSDLYQAQQVLAQAKASRADLESLIGVTENALALLVGRFRGAVRLGGLDRLPAPIAEPALAVPSRLLFQRPDVRAAYERLRAIDAQVGAAFAEHFPAISLGASIGARLDIDPVAMISNLFANLMAPLFQGGRVQAQLDEREGQLREFLASYKQLLLVALKEVEDALVRGQALTRRITHLEQLVAASEGALRLSVDQYLQGLSGYLNVLSAEQSLFSARLELITARRELISARISLARAVGGSWMDPVIRARRAREEGQAS